MHDISTFEGVAKAMGVTPRRLAQGNVDAMRRIAKRLGKGADRMGNSGATYSRMAKDLEAKYCAK